MASVENGSSVPAAADTPGNLWGAESQGKVTRRRALAAGGVLGAAALGLGLYFGLKEDGQQTQKNIISGQADANAVGCFADTRADRTMEARLTDEEGMTPAVCNAHCEDNGYYYYAVQWGVECWCAPEETVLDKHGLAECDYACAGDESQICGGYYAFTAYEVGTESTSPSPTPSISTDCSGGAATIRFTSEIAYFEGGGCGTLTDMYNAQTGDGPLYVLDDDDEVVGGTPTGRWLLTRNLRVVGGATLSVHGTSIGGDADVLRIESTGSDYWEVRGYGGNLSFKSTKVTSWDTSNGGEREWSSSGGRSFINCVTQFDDSDKWDCDGASNQEHGECRMDIIDSVMGNLGFFDAESYGLTWKVRGMCKELGDDGLPVNHEIFEDHNVYGDIMGSEIYGMYYGHYSYGHQGGVWTNNKMHDNILYGFDPHDDSDDLEIAFNEVWGNGNHGIIASKRCNNVKIHDNEVWGGGESAAGIFLHRSSDDAEVYNNYVHDMQDAGMALMESFNADIHDNVFENCKYGIRLSLGSGENQIYDNTFTTFSQYGLYTYEGSDAPDVPDNNGSPKNNVFTNNEISDVDIGVHIKEGEDNEFVDNTFTNVARYEFEDSSGTLWSGNAGAGCVDSSSSSFASGSDAPSAC